MVLERVKSKSLFNFRPQGFVDEDIEVYENEKRALRARLGTSRKIGVFSMP